MSDEGLDMLCERAVDDATKHLCWRLPLDCEFRDERFLHDEGILSRKFTGAGPGNESDKAQRQ